jgi:hypothetical protein
VSYIYSVSIKQLQQKLIQLLGDLNCKEFTFEEIVIPTIPQGKVIFEFGLADSGGFNFIDEAEVKKALGFIAKQQIHSLDFFCAIRYYKRKGDSRKALKFDYYMIRTVFNKGTLEVQVFHERGPRYISPEEVASIIFFKVNESAEKKILKPQDV